MLVKVKPLSVNQAWQGRRYKTDKYKSYEKEVLLKLRKYEIPEGELEIYLRFGLSSKLADWDNPVKPFQDCLQKKYGFDDRRIRRAVVDIDDVKKGDEYIYFELNQLNKELEQC